MNAQRAGFTLVEVLVALTLAGLAALLVHALFRSVVDGGATLERHRTALDREMNAERWLVEVLGSVEVGLEGDTPFRGTAQRLECTALIQVAGGWRERVTLVLTWSGSSLVAQAGPDRVVLRDSVSAFAMDYLIEPGLQARWVRGWESPVSAPLALRLRTTARIAGVERTDTLLVPLGARG